MIAPDFRFEGFDAHAWLRLLSLVQGKPAPAPGEAVVSPGRHGTLVIVRGPDGAARASFVTGRGPVELDTAFTPAALEQALARHGAQRAIVLDHDALESVIARATPRVLASEDYASQWLSLLAAAREVEQEGKLLFHPPRNRLRLPTPAMWRRALDVLLPEGYVILLAVWEGAELWTACALLRQGDEIACMIGPERLLEWTGPLGGDYRRDQRALQRAVARALGPLHLGVFAQRAHLEEQLRDYRPGSWARAVALRDVIVEPAPAYVHVALSADAARAAGRKASEWLGGLDLAAYLGPVAQLARERIGRVGSLTQILGWNPLQVLSTRLRKTPSDGTPPPAEP
jgi:hypothetical protein